MPGSAVGETLSIVFLKYKSCSFCSSKACLRIETVFATTRSLEFQLCSTCTVSFFSFSHPTLDSIIIVLLKSESSINLVTDLYLEDL